MWQSGSARSLKFLVIGVFLLLPSECMEEQSTDKVNNKKLPYEEHRYSWIPTLPFVLSDSTKTRDALINETNFSGQEIPMSRSKEPNNVVPNSNLDLRQTLLLTNQSQTTNSKSQLDPNIFPVKLKPGNIITRNFSEEILKEPSINNKNYLAEDINNYESQRLKQQTKQGKIMSTHVSETSKLHQGTKKIPRVAAQNNLSSSERIILQSRLASTTSSPNHKFSKLFFPEKFSAGHEIPELTELNYGSTYASPFNSNLTSEALSKLRRAELMKQQYYFFRALLPGGKKNDNETSSENFTQLQWEKLLPTLTKVPGGNEPLSIHLQTGNNGERNLSPKLFPKSFITATNMNSQIFFKNSLNSNKHTGSNEELFSKLDDVTDSKERLQVINIRDQLKRLRSADESKGNLQSGKLSGALQPFLPTNVLLTFDRSTEQTDTSTTSARVLEERFSSSNSFDPSILVDFLSLATLSQNKPSQRSPTMAGVLTTNSRRRGGDIAGRPLSQRQTSLKTLVLNTAADCKSSVADLDLLEAPSAGENEATQAKAGLVASFTQNTSTPLKQHLQALKEKQQERATPSLDAPLLLAQQLLQNALQKTDEVSDQVTANESIVPPAITGEFGPHSDGKDAKAGVPPPTLPPVLKASLYSYLVPRLMALAPLTEAIPGVPGLDYPIMSTLPYTNFYCSNMPWPGFYADTEARCQAWHLCDLDGRQASFLCPNGTIFNQAFMVCDWWYNSDCQAAPYLYPLNERLFKLTELPPPTQQHRTLTAQVLDTLFV